jgi:hemerythrin-like domain-containing protein
MTITETLTAEHRVFRDLFDQMAQLVPSLQTLGELRALARLTEGLLRAHSRVEEESLFAALDHCLEHLAQREVFFQQHKEIDARLGRIRRTSRVAEARRLLLGAMAFSRQHFEREEAVLFPLAEQVMKAETLTELAKARARKPGPG